MKNYFENEIFDVRYIVMKGCPCCSSWNITHFFDKFLDNGYKITTIYRCICNECHTKFKIEEY